MRYCPNCGCEMPDGTRFCSNCGWHDDSADKSQSAGYAESIINHINDYVGNDRPAQLNWRVLFTDVFKHHTTAEAEDIFICGTRRTTPQLWAVSKDWPHPWLYSRVFLMFAIAFVMLWTCCNVFGNPNALPGMIVVGAFTVPLSLVILFLEVNAWRDVSLYKVVQMFLVGGCASLVATLLIYSLFGNFGMGYFGALLTGIIEEVGKVVIVLWFLRRMDHLSILKGLLVGASVGAGFAAFESAGYAMQPLIAFLQQSGYMAAYGQMSDASSMMDAINSNIMLRGVLAPGGHVTWAAVSGAALVIAGKARQVMDASLLTDSRFLRLFAIPVVLHALWDCPLAAIGIELMLVPLLLTVTIWIVVLILINMGLAEVERICGDAHIAYAE